MKSKEFINEGIGGYETILQNILKDVNRVRLHPERKANRVMGINELLYELGVEARWNVRTHDHPLSNEMHRQANEYQDAFTHNFKDKTFTRQDIKQFADTLYTWSEAVKNLPPKGFEDTSGLGGNPQPMG